MARTLLPIAGCGTCLAPSLIHLALVCLAPRTIRGPGFFLFLLASSAHYREGNVKCAVKTGCISVAVEVI